MYEHYFSPGPELLAILSFHDYRVHRTLPGSFQNLLSSATFRVDHLGYPARIETEYARRADLTVGDTDAPPFVDLDVQSVFRR